MIRFVLATAFLLTFSPAKAEEDMTDAQRGLGLIIAAQETCDIRLSNDAIGDYVAREGWDRPEILSNIRWWANIQRTVARDGMSDAECTIARRTAETMGILAD